MKKEQLFERVLPARSSTPCYPAKVFVPHDFQSSVVLLQQAPTPVVFVSLVAYETMWHYVDLAEGEVGWLGLVREIPEGFLLEDMYLFEQEVSSTTTGNVVSGLAEVFDRIRREHPEGIRALSRLRFWGHSHVFMNTTPSLTDEEQMERFGERCPWFIRGILNKLGRMEFTLFLYEKGVKIVDVPWRMQMLENEALRRKIRSEFAQKVQDVSFPPEDFSYASIPVIQGGIGKVDEFGWDVDYYRYDKERK